MEQESIFQENDSQRKIEPVHEIDEYLLETIAF
jgi:hypothetical protein